MKCKKLPRKDIGVPFSNKNEASNFLSKCINKKGFNGKIVESNMRYKGKSPTYFVYKTDKIKK